MCILLALYLENRSSNVVVGEATSHKAIAEVGVPQGSVLGPTLYPLYINDFSVMEDTITILFADDAGVIVRDKVCGAAVDKLEAAVNKIIEWASSWNIKPNKNQIGQS